MSGNCYYCGGHPDEPVDLRRRRDELEAEIERLRASHARLSEQNAARQKASRDCYEIEGCPHWVEACTRYQRAEARLAEAEKIIREVATSYPVAAGTSKYGYEKDHDGYGSIRECRLYLERHSAPVSGVKET